MNQSIVAERGSVSFPAFTGEHVYMLPFLKKEGVPQELSRWQPTVDAMLDGIETDLPIYLMIDQKACVAGVPHRRPGKHIDGYWIPAIHSHGGGHGTHVTDAKQWPVEAILLASDVQSSRAWLGSYEGVIGVGGDCSHIDTSHLVETRLQESTCYAGNVSMLHESLPVAADCLRTLVRLNVPGWSPA